MNGTIRRITVRRKPGDLRRGILAAGPFRIACALGRSGTTVFKREGDGATPVAEMRLVKAWYRTRTGSGRKSRPASRLCTREVQPGKDGWCDEPTHASYNRHVRLPFRASAESLARTDRLYDVVVVLDWNYSRRGRGRGSAIFFHIARPGFPPTEGCVAIEPSAMRLLMPFLSPRTRLVVHR
ncbi:L,D-transpeptidase family protein [Jiella mangrovi]|uniref:L,D-TPase catalytic domain-containing protein n=1 Tax=Jiella mangrovi TaxID=2821407 RepID=A0ABS4BI91_9HYPH|nr:L,D-transpeptidase family protein [Jiella mangrovi]MBP0616252.1 hypothetical protein [Jiella mangrovi]